MASTRDAALALAEELIRLLEAQRGLGPPSYPLPVRRLIELACSHATAGQVEKAIGTRWFQQRVAIARAKNRDAPIALVSDLESLAGSRLLLEFMLQSLRTPSNQAFSAAQLKSKTSHKLQQPFQAALARQIEQGSLPPTVGWITISRAKKLFLVADLHLGHEEPRVAALRSTAEPSIRSEGASARDRLDSADAASHFAQDFDRVFDALDRRAGAHNFVSLVDLRAALPVGRETFDRALHQLRMEGRYGLSAAEGRHGVTPEESAAAITEDGTLLLYVSRKMP